MLSMCGKFNVLWSCILTIQLFSVSTYGALFSAPEPDTIENSHITNWGPWGNWEQCPYGTFAHGFASKVAPYDLKSDNTALNGIRLFCSPPGIAQETMAGVSSSVGGKGDWGPTTTCGGDPMTGFRLKGVLYKGTKLRLWKADTDDVAAIAIQAYSDGTPCTNPEVKDYEDPASQWTEVQSCADGYAVCGIQTQVDELGIEYDKTALNNIRLKCCSH